MGEPLFLVISNYVNVGHVCAASVMNMEFQSTAIVKSTSRSALTNHGRCFTSAYL